MNNSRRRLWAMTWNSGRRSQRPAASTATIASTPPSTGSRLPARRSSPSPLISAEASARKGTNARSWNSSIAKASRPWVRLSSERSVSCCSRMAVELMAIAPPSTIATSHGTPSRCATSANTLAVTLTCSAPRPNTSRRMASMRGRENSSPRVKRRNATPSSASRRVAPESASTPKAYGPRASPTTRYAMLVGSASRRATVTRNTEPASRIRHWARGVNIRPQVRPGVRVRATTRRGGGQESSARAAGARALQSDAGLPGTGHAGLPDRVLDRQAGLTRFGLRAQAPGN